MSNFPVARATAGGAIAFAIACTMVVAGAWPAATMAAPLSCAATPSPAQPPASPAGQPAAPIPTEAVIAAEVNPPGDIPDNQAFVTYTAKDGGYSIAMPEGWARQESGPNVSFEDKLHRFSVEVRCAETAPTIESAQTVEAAALAQQVPAFELVDVTAVDLPAGPGILVRYRTNSAPDEVTGKQIRLDVDRYELFKDGREVVISLAVPAGSDNVDVSNQVSRSFRWTA